MASNAAPAQSSPLAQNDSSAPPNPPPNASAAPKNAAPTTTGEKKLTPKELKEKKKAEKAARRAESKASAPTPVPAKQQQKKQQQGGKKGAEGIVKTIYVTGNEKPGAKGKEAIKEIVEVCTDSAKDRGLVGLLRDLEHDQAEKKKIAQFGIENAHPDVHAAILTLGMQINKRVVAGSTARCLGFLLAIKRVHLPLPLFSSKL